MRRTEVFHFVFTESQRKSLVLAFCLIFPFSSPSLPPSPKACVFLIFYLFQTEQFWSPNKEEGTHSHPTHTHTHLRKGMNGPQSDPQLFNSKTVLSLIGLSLPYLLLPFPELDQITGCSFAHPFSSFPVIQSGK